MLPKIKRVEFRNVHIDDGIYTDNDVLLLPHGVEVVEPSHNISAKDFKKMMLHEPEIAILGMGFRGKLKISPDILDAAKKQKVELITLPTPDAAKKFHELARKGKKVVAKLHITC